MRAIYEQLLLVFVVLTKTKALVAIHHASSDILTSFTVQKMLQGSLQNLPNFVVDAWSDLCEGGVACHTLHSQTIHSAFNDSFEYLWFPELGCALFYLALIALWQLFAN